MKTDVTGLVAEEREHELPYILVYKSPPRINRPLKSESFVWSKIVDPCIIRRWLFEDLYWIVLWKNWLSAYKTGNISETGQDRAKVTINSLYKVVLGLSIAARMDDLE